MSVFQLAERGWLLRQSDFPELQSSFTQRLLPDAEFEALQQWLATRPPDFPLQAGAFRRKLGLQFAPLVGLLPLGNFGVAELLPKIAEDLSGSRKLVLAMLATLPDFPFKNFGSNGLASQNHTLYHIFAAHFLQDTEQLLRGGLVQMYQTKQLKDAHLKGKMLTTKQVYVPELVPQTFWQFQTHLTDDIPANQALKAAVTCIEQVLGTSPKSRQLAVRLAHLSPLSNTEAIDWQPWLSDIRFSAYKTLLPWAHLFLNGQWPAFWQGEWQQQPLLFRMEHLFESYVASGFRNYAAGWQVAAQPRQAFLTSEKKHQVHLKPDLIIEKQGERWVIDTKWKLLDTAISPLVQQADLFQIFTYAQQWQATRVVLLYPDHAGFSQPQRWEFGKQGIPLWISPFDLQKPLPEAVHEIIHCL